MCSQLFIVLCRTRIITIHLETFCACGICDVCAQFVNQFPVFELPQPQAVGESACLEQHVVCGASVIVRFAMPLFLGHAKRKQLEFLWFWCAIHAICFAIASTVHGRNRLPETLRAKRLWGRWAHRLRLEMKQDTVQHCRDALVWKNKCQRPRVSEMVANLEADLVACLAMQVCGVNRLLACCRGRCFGFPQPLRWNPSPCRWTPVTEEMCRFEQLGRKWQRVWVNQLRRETSNHLCPPRVVFGFPFKFAGADKNVTVSE